MRVARPQRSADPGPQASAPQPTLRPSFAGGAAPWRPPTTLPLPQAREAFLFELEASGRTRYRQAKVALCLRTFEAFLREHQHSFDLAAITPDDVRRWVLWLREGRPRYGEGDPRAHVPGGLSERTTNDRLVDLKTFFNWLVLEGYLTRSPAAAVRRLPQPETELAVLSHAQIAALLKAPDRSSWTGYRDYAILAVLYDMGLRVSELVGLRVDDLRWPEHCLRVWGKGQRERRVPFGDQGRRALAGWVQRRGDPPTDRLFVSMYGEPIDRRRVQRILTHYGERVRIRGVRLSPHTLRHTFATHYLEAGGDLFTLQAILGHRSLDMVRRYAHVTERTVRLRHRQFSPLDRIRERPAQEHGERYSNTWGIGGPEAEPDSGATARRAARPGEEAARRDDDRAPVGHPPAALPAPARARRAPEPGTGPEPRP